MAPPSEALHKDKKREDSFPNSPNKGLGPALMANARRYRQHASQHIQHAYHKFGHSVFVSLLTIGVRQCCLVFRAIPKKKAGLLPPPQFRRTVTTS